MPLNSTLKMAKQQILCYIFNTIKKKRKGKETWGKEGSPEKPSKELSRGWPCVGWLRGRGLVTNAWCGGGSEAWEEGTG